MDQSESTAANLVRRSRRRWLQFSLRGLIVMLTIGCVWPGWKVERARKRGRAIDALVVAGADVLFVETGDGLNDKLLKSLKSARSGNHFWLDWEGVRVSIHLPMPLNAAICSELSSIHGTLGIEIEAETTDSQLQYLESTDARMLFITHAPSVTDEAKEELQRRLPNAIIDMSPIGPGMTEDLVRRE